MVEDQQVPISVSIYDIDSLSLIDPESCSIYSPEPIKKPLEGCDMVQDSVEGLQHISKFIEDIVFYDVSDGECKAVKGKLPSICNLIEQDIDSSSPIDISYEDLISGNPLDCSIQSIKPLPTLCDETSDSTDYGVRSYSEVRFLGTDKDSSCGTFVSRCNGDSLGSSALSSDTVSVKVGEMGYNSIEEGGDSYGSVKASLTLTNNSRTGQLYVVKGDTRLARSVSSDLEKIQAISYQGPAGTAPTGSGSSVQLGTTTFSGIEEYQGSVGEIDYRISELPYGDDTNYGDLFPNRPDGSGGVSSDGYSHTRSLETKTFHFLEPNESKEIILSTVLRLNKPVATLEDLIIEHKLNFQLTNCAELV